MPLINTFILVELNEFLKRIGGTKFPERVVVFILEISLSPWSVVI